MATATSARSCVLLLVLVLLCEPALVHTQATSKLASFLKAQQNTAWANNTHAQAIVKKITQGIVAATPSTLNTNKFVQSTQTNTTLDNTNLGSYVLGTMRTFLQRNLIFGRVIDGDWTEFLLKGDARVNDNSDPGTISYQNPFKFPTNNKAFANQLALVLILVGSWVWIPDTRHNAVVRCEVLNQPEQGECHVALGIKSITTSFCVRSCGVDIETGKATPACPRSCCKCTQGDEVLGKFWSTLVGGVLLSVGVFVMFVSGVALLAIAFYVLLGLVIVSNFRLALVCDSKRMLNGDGCW
eukprot:c760_g1_i1.p1 GENE.c760_g1_i1~~c760_g1_i1.p1  ORF type:complete len:298 (+),score=113.30 c760_g1_i1:26-919(+)